MRARILIIAGLIVGLLGTPAAADNPSAPDSITAPLDQLSISITAPPDQLSITHVAVREGDAAVYRGPCGEQVLIDANGHRHAEVLSVLDAYGSRALHTVVASHYDADHIGALVSVATSPGVSVGRWIDRGGDASVRDTQVYRDYHAHVTASGNRVTARVGESFSVCTGDEEVRFEVVSVAADGGNTIRDGVMVTEEADTSICLRIVFRSFRGASCGDINGTDVGSRTDVESLVAPHIGQVDWAKVNHHGSRHASNPTWVDTLGASAAVISTGANGLGHPDEDVEIRWAATGTSMWQTHRGGPATSGGNELLDGHVTVTTDGRTTMRVAGQTGRAGTHQLHEGTVQPPPPPGPTVPTSRVSGADRWETAVAISQHAWDSADTVLVATGFDYPDALASAPLAGAVDAPVLLTPGDQLLPVVTAELARLDPSMVVVIGGTSAVSDAVVRQIGAATGARVDRISGADRFATSAQVAAHVREHAPSEGIYIAAGGNFPDALAAGALVPTDPSPILLAADAGLTPEVSEAAAPAVFATVFGGGTAVPPAVIDALADLGVESGRIAGRGRYETSAAALDVAFSRFDGAPRPLLLATGAQFPDALAAGALAVRLDAPVLLVAAEGLVQAQHELLSRHQGRISEVIAVGGTGAVPDHVLRDVATALGNEEQ